MHRSSLRPAAAIAAVLVLLAARAVVAGPAPAAAAAPAECVIRFEAATTPAERDAWLLAAGAEVLYEFTTSGALLVRLPATGAPGLAALQADPRLAHAEFGAPGVPDLIPDDPLYALQPHFRDAAHPDTDLQAEPAWDLRHDAPDVKVAVIDDGFLLTHPDLAANFIAGYDCGNNDSDPSPDPDGAYFQHGTGVAGLLGAVGNNGLGVAGVCWDLQIMPLKHHNDYHSWYSWSYYTSAAVDRAVAAGVDIIVCSFHYLAEGLDVSPESQFYRSFEAASNAGIIVVAAAGNDGKDIDDPLNARYPACFDFPNIVTVSMTGDRGVVMPQISAHGPVTVDISAPGVSLLSTWLDAARQPTYEAISGTSASVPLVAGVIALAKAANPGLAYPEEVLSLVYARAETPPGNEASVAGGRRANLFRTLAEPDPVAPDPVGQLAVTGGSANSVTVGWLEPGDDGQLGWIDHYGLEYTVVGFPPVVVTDVPSPNGPGSARTCTIGGLPTGAGLDISVFAVDAYRNRSTATIATFVPSARLELPAPAAFFMARAGITRDSTFTVVNAGNADGAFTPVNLAGSPWLRFAPGPVTVPAGGSAPFPYTVDTGGLQHGFYQGQVRLEGSTAQFEVTLVVMPSPSGVEGGLPTAGPALTCRPNPFNPATTISWSLPTPGVPRLRVYDLRGALVRELPAGGTAPGGGQATWDGADARGRAQPSGTYLCRLELDGRVAAPALRLQLVR